MRARLVHGLLLGAGWCALAGSVEFLVLLLQHPDQRDLAGWLPAWAAAGTAGLLVGLLAGLVLPLLARRREWRTLPGIYLAGVVLGVVAAVLLWPRLPWHASVRFGVVVLAALAVQQATRAAAGSRFGWWFASLFTPLSAVALLVLSGCLALFAGLLDPLPGPRTTLPEAEAEEAHPNLLLVLLRDTGAEHLGAFGSYRPTSPRLDELAREGVLFESLHAASPEPGPAFDALLGADLQTDGSAPVLVEALRRAGYLTAGFGSAQAALDRAGRPLGYTVFHETGRPDPLRRTLLRRRWHAWHAWRERDAGPAPDAAAAVAARALRWLEREREAGRPFLLLTELAEAAPPHQPPAELRDRFLPSATEEGLDDDDAELARLRARHDAEILHQDGALGALIDGLRDLDLLESTLVVVVGDRGLCFHPHHRASAAPAALSCRTRVPLVLRRPSELPAGTRHRPVASSSLLAPTLLQAMGLAAEEDGQPALPPVGAEDPTAPRECLVLDPVRGDAVLRTQDAVLLRRRDGSLGFRDLTHDPEERAPLDPPQDEAGRAAAQLLGARLAERLGG